MTGALLMERVGCIFKCYYANLLAWKANGDPRTDDYTLKKKKIDPNAKRL